MTHYITKYRLFAIAAAALITLSVSAAPASAETKIGAVNLQKVMDNSVAGKAALTKLKSEAEKASNTLKGKADAIQALEKEIEGQRMMMRPETLAEKDQKLRSMKREFELLREDTKNDIQRKQGMVTRKLVTDVMRIIKEYGTKNGYSLVVETGTGGTMMGPIILFTDEAIDITAEIVKIYDKENSSAN
jgi:outer membrane protein